MTLATLLAYLVAFVAMPINWYVAWKLIRLSRIQPHLRTLRERAVAALSVAVIVTVFAVIFINNEQLPPPLNGDVTKLLTRGTVLILSVAPAAYWLYLYRVKWK